MTKNKPASPPLPGALNRRQLVAGAGVALALSSTPWRANAAAKTLQATVEGWAAANAFQGVVMVGRSGRVAYARSFGTIDIEAGRPARIDDVYRIASISKWLTTLAVLRLVERGKLALDHPITTWLPDFRADTGKRVTLRRMLSNSSGLTEQFKPAAAADPSLFTLDIPAAEAARRFVSGDLAFEPGARFDYTFANWIVIYAIVERVAGLPFADAIRTLVLDPLGLRHTGTGARFETAAAAVPSYRTVSPLVRRPYMAPLYLAASGGYLSNARDLLRAAHGVFDRGFLSRESIRQLITVEMPADEYALGGRVKMLPFDGKDRAVAWETGNTAGYRSVLAHRLDARHTVVILNNTSLSQRLLDEFAKPLFASI